MAEVRLSFCWRMNEDPDVDIVVQVKIGRIKNTGVKNGIEFCLLKTGTLI
jgi:hypothetical protein